MNVLITANSPGEVASWLRPVVAAFQTLAPEAAIRVCLAPCAFATGAEEAVVRSLPGVRAVYTPRETVAWALAGRRPRELQQEWPLREPGVVLFLGGDLFYAALLGWRTGWPAAAYTEGRIGWSRRFQRFFLPDEQARRLALQRGAEAAKLLVTGDLMVDALTLRWPRGEGRAQLGLKAAPAPVVGLFPGSRRYEVRHAVPAFLRAAAHIAGERPGTQFVLALSPFVTPEVLLEALGDDGLFSPPGDKLVAMLFRQGEGAAAGYPWSPEHQALWVEWIPGEPEGASKAKTAPVRALFVRGASFDVAAASDVVMTIPGSNTAELAALGVPMVVAVPLDRLEEMPLEGLPGLLGNVPVLGRALRRRAIEGLIRKLPFASWPNRKAGREVVPELVKRGLTPQDMAQAVLRLLDDEPGRQRMAEELRQLMGEPGAARRIAAACLALAAKART